MPCSRCPGPVPVMSVALARRILAQVPELQRPKILIASFEWLCGKDEGIRIYEGITGRPYTDREKDAIALDQGVVAGLPCPYHTPNGCMLGELGPQYNARDEHQKAPYGWLPTLVAREWDRATLTDMAKRREIADAKISLLTRNAEFYTREMVGIT